MPASQYLLTHTDLTVDLSLKRTMTTFHRPITADVDEIKIFECDKHDDDDQNNRLSPVIKDEEIFSMNIEDRLNSEAAYSNFFPYFLGPYHSSLPSEKSISFNSLTNTNSAIYSVSNSNSWRTAGSFSYGISPSERSSSTGKRSSQNRKNTNESSTKKSHIKKPLNAFMLFMKEQRSQVVQECTLRESAAINQILGRKWHELDRDVQQKYYDMARNERLRHMQLYPGWSARDNYGVKKKRSIKGKKRDRPSTDNVECLNQKKCRARFGLDQQSNWCKHCKRKKKCLRYTENETVNIEPNSWSEDNDTDQIDDSNDDEDLNSQIGPNNSVQQFFHPVLSTTMDSDEENKLRMFNHSFSMPTIETNKDSFLRPYFSSDSFYPTTAMPIVNNHFQHDT